MEAVVNEFRKDIDDHGRTMEARREDEDVINEWDVTNANTEIPGLKLGNPSKRHAWKDLNQELVNLDPRGMHTGAVVYFSHLLVVN